MRRVPGGVTGWLAERAATRPGVGSGAARRSTPPVDGTAPRRGKPKPERTGPSPSTVGRRLRETEQAMVKAQRRVDQLTGRLAEVADHDELTALGVELAEAQGELDQLEGDWLELAELAES